MKEPIEYKLESIERQIARFEKQLETNDKSNYKFLLRLESMIGWVLVALPTLFLLLIFLLIKK